MTFAESHRVVLGEHFLHMQSYVCFSQSSAYVTESFLHSKILVVPKEPDIAKAISRKKNQVGGILLPDIKVCYKVIIAKQHGPGIKKQTHRSMK